MCLRPHLERVAVQVHGWVIIDMFDMRSRTAWPVSTVSGCALSYVAPLIVQMYGAMVPERTRS